MWYNYTDTIRLRKKAWKTKEVCQLVNRKLFTIELAWNSGQVEKPQFTYTLDENRRLFQYMWSEEDIMGLLEFLSTVHRGRPRADGEVHVTNLPTPRELRAMLNDEDILYVKQGDTFVPSWQAKEF